MQARSYLAYPGTINLTDMKDVRYDPKSQNRFELETYERTFVFK
jgi:hypothetical protein